MVTFKTRTFRRGGEGAGRDPEAGPGGGDAYEPMYTNSAASDVTILLNSLRDNKVVVQKKPEKTQL